MSKSLSIVCLDNGSCWVMSNYTGEIAKPWEVKTIFGMIRVFFRYKAEPHTRPDDFLKIKTNPPITAVGGVC